MVYESQIAFTLDTICPWYGGSPIMTSVDVFGQWTRQLTPTQDISRQKEVLPRLIPCEVPPITLSQT